TNRLPALGFSSQAAERFAWLGIRQLGDLFHWKETQLRSIVGSDAARLLALLQGPWSAQVPRYQPQRMISASHEFSDPVLEPFELEPAVRRLAMRLRDGLGDSASTRVIVTTENFGLKMPDEIIPKEP